MAKKERIIYFCKECGSSQPKWTGRCPDCGAWNTMVEEKVSRRAPISRPHSAKAPIQLSDRSTPPRERVATDIAEIDRVIGGGFVSGSIALLAGEPGVGKSTLILQILEKLPLEKALYFSGEESEEQIQMRAMRLGIEDEKILISCENQLQNILHQIETQRPRIVVIDSIQTAYSDEFDNVPGSITQVRECAGKLQRQAKERGIIMVLVGHITKSGMIAGPKVLEHLVDTVLYLESNRNNSFRILRSVKNRFGATQEVGIFEMQSKGLRVVENPAQVFLSERRQHVPGSAIAVSMEGTRPFLLEVQSLVTQTSYGTPQRTANGLDYRRLAMLIAVLEKRVGLPLGSQDVFVNVVGGMKVDDPAIDLAVTAAIASSFKNVPIPPDAALIGEVGLVGEIRSSPFLEQRVREAAKQGYRQIYIAQSNRQELQRIASTELHAMDSIGNLFQKLF